VHEKDEQIRSLEEKHLHARDALEHYRSAVKDQREQEQRRHEGQLQQIQVEHRQLQQTLSVKQDELSRLNRDNERLLSDSRQQTKIMTTQDGTIARLTAQLNSLAIASAREEGAREQLIDQLAHCREESVSLRESVTQANALARNTQTLLEANQNEVDQLRQELKKLQDENSPSRSERADDQRQE
jgi:chromosome segregation ATPase